MSEQKASKYYPAEEEAQMKKVRANAYSNGIWDMIEIGGEEHAEAFVNS